MSSRLTLLLTVGLIGCVQPLEPNPPEDTSSLAPGETRQIELRALRLDVEGVQQRLDMDGLRSLPAASFDELWLLDLELSGLVANTLTQLRDLPYDEALEQPQAAQNMRTLLRTTPDNVSLDGTSLEEMIALSAALGIPPARALGDLLEVGVTDPIIDIDVASESVLVGLIGSHPATRTRKGPVTEDHPDGQYPVAPNSLPILLSDVVNEFDNLTETFGPASTEWGQHPKFIEHAEGLTVTEEDFAMTVKVNANALPYKGVDLGNATSASVNSIPGQIDTLFPTQDPDWLTIEGMVERPRISELTVFLQEDDIFHAGGDTRTGPLGNSSAFEQAPWVLERIIAEMTYELAQDVSPHTVSYQLGTGVDAFQAVIAEDRWVTFETFNNAGNPPAPAYLWDLMIELGQVRLHDGGLAEGEADVAFTLRDLELGVSSEDIIGEIRRNMAEDPAALQGLATALVDSADGEADLFYVRPPPGSPSEGDWLYFVEPIDIPVGDDGPVRPYTYTRPGFFTDPALTAKASSKVEVEGDVSHEKVQIEVGDLLYVEDAEGLVYELAVLDKPSNNRVALEITRL